MNPAPEISPPKVIRTLRVRVKDRHAPILRRMAYEVNQAWNLINEWTRDAAAEPIPGAGWVRTGVVLSAFDINNRLNGYTKSNDVAINMFTLQEAAKVHYQARRQFKRSLLRWRVSNGPRRNLGWIPIRQGGAQFKDGQIRYAGSSFKVWDSYDLGRYKFKSASFSEDARGRWYFNVAVEEESRPSAGTALVGIDLGLKDVATCSDGQRLPRAAFYRDIEQHLGIAQRANQKARVRALHAAAKNRRRDALHKFSSALVDDYGAIAVGNVSSTALVKTRMAKSVLDAGWGMLRTMIEYKALARRSLFVEVNESYTTQTCSCCGSRRSSPKGRTGLGIRQWTCECGVTHDRDVNAAKNIAALGHERLAGGIPGL
jgi:putative transposase